jgi:hypothetical protein
MSDNAEIRQILIGAKSLIETNGWCQKKYASKEGGFCMAGAIGKVMSYNKLSYGDKTLCLAIDILRKSIEVGVKSGYYSIGDYNDAPGRTKAEVLAMFDKAIASLDKTE